MPPNLYDTPMATSAGYNAVPDVHMLVKAFYDACKTQCGFNDQMTGDLTQIYLTHLLDVMEGDGVGAHRKS